MPDDLTEERPKHYEWTEEAINQIRKRLAMQPNSFLVAYCVYVFDPDTKGIDVSANFIGDGHQPLDAETEAQFRAVNQRFTEDVKKIFELQDTSPLDSWGHLK